MNASLTWNDSLLLGFGPMDATHHEFVACIAKLGKAMPCDVSDHMAGMLHHLTGHFEEERQWMIQTDFPAAQCHLDEHDAVLRSARAVMALVEESSNVAEAHRLATALASWFEGHLLYMDSALSHWMSKRAHGGAPVVIRRDLAASLRADAPI